MKKIFFTLMLCICSLILMTSLQSCTKVKVGADEEAALVMQPWFFGHGGVNEKPVSTGLEWCALTTHPVYFKIVPWRYDEKFDDLFSNDNTPLDFHTSIIIQIEKGKTPILLRNYGEYWYENNIQRWYRNKTREYVSMYGPFDLMSNREILREIDSKISKDIAEYIKQKSDSSEFPIKVVEIITDRATPNPSQLAEMDNTATAIQQTKTQERLREMESVREAAERQRAIADRAYMNSMGLTANQYIELRAWEIIEKKEGANVDVLFNGSTDAIWNIRR